MWVKTLQNQDESDMGLQVWFYSLVIKHQDVLRAKEIGSLSPNSVAFLGKLSRAKFSDIY